MNIIEKHKALLITFLISGILVMAMFSFHISKKAEFIAESYFEIEPQTEEELEALEQLKALEELAKTNPETNEAFNENEEFKEMMRNFKSVDSYEDSRNAPEESVEESSSDSEDLMTSNSTYGTSKTYALKQQDRNSFNKANDVLAMHSKKDEKNLKNNANSSVSFSLSNRNKVKLPPPIYLCEVSGKIVVNITVDAQGQIVDTYINSSSSSTNQCLIDTALEYAKNAVFSSADRKTQIGSITYYFKGK